MDSEPLYPIIHIERRGYRSMDYPWQPIRGRLLFLCKWPAYYTGGDTPSSIREAIVKTIRDFYKKDFDASDIRASIIAAISIKVEERY
jgi:topoisomerase-4 subunit B